uniref:Moesin/ezrin/radixin homolog 1 n=1 Tax=Parascaris univalens TaxID=6257 RepID=A0A914ZDJ0_PARUN
EEVSSSRPIKPGLSSRCDRLSRPAHFNITSGYSTVSDRAINVVVGMPSSSSQLPRQSVGTRAAGGSMPHINGHRVSDTGSSSGSRAAVTFPYASYSASAPRPHRHRPSQQNTHPSGAVSDGERMCISDADTSISHAASVNSSRYAQSSQSKALAAKHHTAAVGSESVSETEGSVDPLMSLSLPNVLGADVQLVCKEFELKCECPPKSASGDNFLEMQQTPREYDNVSEESYRLSDHEQRALSHPETVAAQMSSVYATTFTTKRVGNVIVKRIVTNSRSTPNTTDDEDGSSREPRPSHSYGKREGSEGPYQGGRDSHINAYQNITFPSSYPPGSSFYSRKAVGEKRIAYSSSSAPSSSVEYPIHKKLVPVEIDGPNVKLDDYIRREEKRPVVVKPIKPDIYKNPVQTTDPTVVSVELKEASTVPASTRVRKTPIIYTSTGAILQKPKIIPDIDTYKTEEAIYSRVRVAQSPDQAQNSAIVSQAHFLPKTYGAVGPLPGKVISKENLVVTPEGLREKRVKPAVPPKPKNLTSPSSVGEQPSVSPSTAPSKPSHPVVNLQHEEVEIMQKTAKAETLQRPALISVQSEDRPDIKKCHLFNSDIPYVLTMRNISSDRATTPESGFSTFKGPAGSRTLPETIASSSYETASLLRNRAMSRSPDSFKRRKSLDLVPRKRLPSPGNFSSQDHSISPTTPESGDILEYLLRRRSASNERSALAKRGKRGDPRRQTQPVRFNLPPSPEIEHHRVSFASEPNLNDETVDNALCDNLSLQEEGSAAKSITHAPLNRSMSNIENSTIQQEQQEEKVEKIASEPPVPAHASEPVVVSSGQKETSVDDDLPPLPPPPPPPPPLVPALFRDPILSEPMPAPPSSLAPLSDTSIEPVPFADESASSRTSFASREDSGEQKDKDKQTSVTSATLRTPTGVLWTDF